MYSMKETCDQVNMSYEALKFYCNEGLVPNVKRDANNRRIFDDNDVFWINSLSCLKNCGMSIKEMKHYIELCKLGEASIPERQVILSQLKDALLIKMEELHKCIAYVDQKQQFYTDVLTGKTQYFSNLIEVEAKF